MTPVHRILDPVDVKPGDLVWFDQTVQDPNIEICLVLDTFDAYMFNYVTFCFLTTQGQIRMQRINYAWRLSCFRGKTF